jgi:hypothetical protein
MINCPSFNCAVSIDIASLNTVSPNSNASVLVWNTETSPPCATTPALNLCELNFGAKYSSMSAEEITPPVNIALFILKFLTEYLVAG